MARRDSIPSALAAIVLCLAAAAPIQSQAKPRDLVCFVVVDEGNSSEGNSLYLRKMGADPEALKSFAPSRFSSEDGGFKAVVEGRFAYEAGTPVLRDRNGRTALYEVPLRLSADAPPKAQQLVTLQFRLADLASSGGLVQPALKAMQLAAAKLGWHSGLAWIVKMERIGPGALRAVVGLAR